MTALSGRVFFDACTLENFAAVEHLDLLRTLYEGRCAWTDAVEHDIRRRIPEEPYLQPIVGAVWLGDPIAIDDPVALQHVERIRRALGGSRHLATQHLGEAQTVYYMGEVERDAIFATDDRRAGDLARRREMKVLDTADILAECYAAGLLGCPQAYELLQKMAAAGRGVAVPASHWYICPPAT